MACVKTRKGRNFPKTLPRYPSNLNNCPLSWLEHRWRPKNPPNHQKHKKPTKKTTSKTAKTSQAPKTPKTQKIPWTPFSPVRVYATITGWGSIIILFSVECADLLIDVPTWFGVVFWLVVVIVGGSFSLSSSFSGVWYVKKLRFLDNWVAHHGKMRISY